MKSLLLKISSLSVAALTVLALTLPQGQTQAQTDCSSYVDQNNGNLLGYIIATNLPSSNEHNRIWVNSSDDPWAGGPDYGVTYDRDLELFSGRGWNEGLRVWVDFDLGTSDQARVTEADGTPVGGFAWGYWEGRIEALNNLLYSNNAGAFVVSGEQPHDSEYVSGDEDGDVPVGLGELLFDQVVFEGPNGTIPPECEEYVDVLADGSTSVDLDSCNDTVELVWNSNYVVSGSCSTVDNSAPWIAPGYRPETYFSGETSGEITDTNSPAYFTIECEGEISGNPVTGVAKVTCEGIDDPDDGGTTTGPGPGSGSGGNSFEFIES